MKLLLIINSLGGGGAERCACTLAQHWSEQGHEVTIVTLHGGETAYELPHEVRVLTFTSRHLLRGPGKLLALAVAALELQRLLQTLEPDATLSFLTRSNFVHLLTRLLGNRRAIFISERSHSETDYVGAKRMVGRIVQLVYPLATRTIAVSEAVRSSLGRMGIPLSQVTTIYNPQNLQRIRETIGVIPRKPNPTAPFRMVMAGRLDAPKDYGTLLEALALLRHRNLDVRLVVLGDGPLRVPLEEQARSLGIGEFVEWRGWIPNVHEAMASCDVFTFSSRYEGFPNALVEAMACGLPVISTDCPGGPREALEGGKHGLLVRVGDHVAIANAVQQLREDPVAYADARARALARAEAYDVARIGDQYLEALELANGNDR